MKKILTIFMTLILIMISLFCSACTNLSYMGNYNNELTENELKAFLKKIDVMNALMENTDTTRTFGIDAHAKLNTNISLDTFNFMFNTEDDIKFRAKTGTKSANGYISTEFSSELEMGFGGKLPSKLLSGSEDDILLGAFIDTFTDNPLKISGKGYIDNNSDIFLNGKFSIGDKINLDGKIAFMISEMSEITAEGADEVVEEIEDALKTLKEVDAKEIISLLEEAGLKVYLDSSKGYKFKICLSEETEEYIKTSLDIKLSDKVDISDCSIYIIFDKFCRFKCAKLDIKVDLDCKVAAMQLLGNFNCEMELKNNISEIDSPTNLNDYLVFSL